MPRLRPRTAGAVLCTALPLLAAACADQPLAPRALPDAAAWDRRGDDTGPPLVRNGRHYRAQRQPHATGRSGSATLQARALLGRDGRTELLVTTGELDAPHAPGTIAKLQVKLLDADGGHQETRNHPRLDGGGTVLQSYDGRPHGSLFRIQANVRGIDGSRTDVVTLTERVRLRPDVAVTGLLAPATVGVGTRVGIQAVLAELNGDVGAVAACVLYVDGVRADRAEGVWVAEGDAVTCAFSHVFAAPGVHAVEVVAEGVTPGDWDPGNNRRAVSVRVSKPEVPLFGYANAWENAREAHHLTTSRWRGSDGSSNQRESRSDTTQLSQGMTLGGMSLLPLALPATRLDVRIRSGAQTLFAYDGAPSWATRGPGGDCVGHTDGPTTVQACTRPFGTEVTLSRFAGRAVYLSRGAWEVYRAWDGYYYHQSWSEGAAEAVAALPASQVAFDVRVEDGARVFTAAPVVALAGTAQPWGSPVPACRSFTDAWSSTESCTARWGSSTARNGWSYF